MQLRGRQTGCHQTLLAVLMILGAAGLFSCGQGTDHKIYDTATNADNFPEAALSLLEGIETGQVQGYTAITERFGELYTRHPELLDLVSWKVVIDRLGTFFGDYADSLVLRGPGGYVTAADYFQLASFAQPDNHQLHRQAVLFACWADGLAGAGFEPTFFTNYESLNLAATADLTRRFYLRSPEHRQFFDSYLRKPVVGMLNAYPSETTAQLDSLPAADQMLLSLAGLVPARSMPTLVAFAEPGVEIVAAQAVQLDSAGYQVELYLRPLENLTSAVLGRATLQSDIDLYWETELRPVAASQLWQADSIVPIVGRFSVPQTPSAVLIELFVAGHDEPLATESGRANWELEPEALRWR